MQIKAKYANMHKKGFYALKFIKHDLPIPVHDSSSSHSVKQKNGGERKQKSLFSRPKYPELFACPLH